MVFLRNFTFQQLKTATSNFHRDNSFYFKQYILVLFLQNSYGTPELPDCGNLVGAEWMEILRWGDTELSMQFRETNTNTSLHFRKANTNPSMHFRKANTNPSMDFRKANTEFQLQVLLSTLFTISLPSLLLFFTPSFNPN